MANPLKRLITRWANKQQAGFDTDPDFFGKLSLMPNPDPILRRMGKADQVYAGILADSHVIGEVRSIRGAVRKFDYRLVAGVEDDGKAKSALELCQYWLDNYKPSDGISWNELIWQMISSILTGFTIHELIWDYDNGKLLPVLVLDRPNHRFNFDSQAQLKLRTKKSRDGEYVKPGYFVVSRHMPKIKNPYGQALLSSCFWPWTFKTGGFKYFVQYCEKYGLPWPIAKYPPGTQDKDIDKLENAIAYMIENGYAVIPNDDSVEILTAANSGKLPQENLIVRCNNEISKALTGQAMVGEIQEVGARAASETAQGRQYDINKADRDIAVSGMNYILRWITNHNFGYEVPSPKLEFYSDENGNKERAEVYEIASRIGNPSKKSFHSEFGIPQAEDEEDVLKPATPPTEFAEYKKALEFKSTNSTATDAADDFIEEHWLEPVSQMLDDYVADGKSIQDFMEALPKLFIDLSDDELQQITSHVLGSEVLKGASGRA